MNSPLLIKLYKCVLAQTLSISRSCSTYLSVVNTQQVKGCINVSALLRQFRNKKSLLDGKCIHNYIVRESLERHGSIPFLLLQMYCDCGALQDTLAMFSRAEHGNVLSWTFIIKACSYIPDSALFYFRQMQVEGVVPDKFTYIAALAASFGEACLSKGKHMHVQILSVGLDADVFLVTSLLTMYSQCSSIKDARMVFDSMAQRDTVAWNAMLAAYVKAGQDRDALLVFEELQRAEVIPTRATLLSVLEACASLAVLREGEKVHKYILARKLQSDVYIGNALINMYHKCGSLQDARNIFDEMLERDTVSWNTMLAAYNLCEQGEDALVLFDLMQHESVKMDEVTFVNTLSVCANQEHLFAGKQVHALMEWTGFHPTVVVCTALVSMYGKCGRLHDAHAVFSKMQERDVITWNALIAAYAKFGSCGSALELYYMMQSEHVVPDTATFVSLMNVCSSHEKLEEGKQVQKLIQANGFENDVGVGKALICMYCRCGCFEEADNIFNQILDRDVALWNAMIVLYMEHGLESLVLATYSQMLREGFVPDRATCLNIINACASQSNVTTGTQMHACLAGRSSFDFDVIIETALINMYGKCGKLDAACKMFDMMVARDLIAWTTMISLHAQQEQIMDALSLFYQMQQEGSVPDTVTFVGVMSACTTSEALAIGKRLQACVSKSVFDLDIVAGNVLVNMYGKCGNLSDAWDCFEQMHEHNRVTFLNILSACSNHSSVLMGRHVHRRLMISDLNLIGDLDNALINMYGKCGSVHDALNVFNHLQERDIITWNSIITAYAQNGCGEDAIQLFRQMLQERVEPDSLTFVSILSACSDSGLVHEGILLFFIMAQNPKISLLLDHYNCMVDLLAKAGQLQVAENFINRMPLEPTAVSWTTLLGACRSEVDVKRGERAAIYALKLDSEESAPYLLLSSIYNAASTLGSLDEGYTKIFT